jgi:serine/threonine protein kinase
MPSTHANMHSMFQVKISDFGMSTTLEDEHGESGTICGTPNYMPPEVISKMPHGLSSDCKFMYACMYACWHVCLHVCMRASMYMYACMKCHVVFVLPYACIICMYVCIDTNTLLHANIACVYVKACI